MLPNQVVSRIGEKKAKNDYVLWAEEVDTLMVGSCGASCFFRAVD